MFGQGTGSDFIESHMRPRSRRHLAGNSKSVQGAFLIGHLPEIIMRTSFLKLERRFSECRLCVIQLLYNISESIPIQVNRVCQIHICIQ